MYLYMFYWSVHLQFKRSHYLVTFFPVVLTRSYEVGFPHGIRTLRSVRRKKIFKIVADQWSETRSPRFLRWWRALRSGSAGPRIATRAGALEARARRVVAERDRRKRFLRKDTVEPDMIDMKIVKLEKKRTTWNKPWTHEPIISLIRKLKYNSLSYCYFRQHDCR